MSYTYPRSGCGFLGKLQGGSSRLHRFAPLEARDRFPCCRKQTEQPIDAGQRHAQSGLRSHATQPQVTIALHCPLKAAEQEVHRNAVHFSHRRAIQHHCRALHAKALLNFAEEALFGSSIEFSRQLLYGNRPGSKCHCSAHLRVQFAPAGELRGIVLGRGFTPRIFQ